MLWRWGGGGLMLAALSRGGLAQDVRFFQLGTGPIGEIRFPIGGLIASALSNPPGSRPCDRGGSCGVPGLVAVARSTGGSSANLSALADRRIDAALVHADSAWWAFRGGGPYKGKPPLTELRGIAWLYAESLHLVAGAKSGIRTLADLRGKRVSFGEDGQPLHLLGLALLAALGIPVKQIRLFPQRGGDACAALAKGDLDAVLVLDAVPSPAVADLVRDYAATLVPVEGAAAAKVIGTLPYLETGVIAAGSYDSLPAIPTLAMGVIMVTLAAQDNALIRGIAAALWHPSTRKMLAQSTPHGVNVQLAVPPLERLGIPLHDGARQYYQETSLPP